MFRKGNLNPGEKCDIEFFYQSKEINKHYLRVIFQVLQFLNRQVLNGKPIILNLRGETLSRRAHLQILKTEYTIDHVPIDLDLPVTYPIELKNIGLTKMKYELNLEQVEELNKRNFDFRILDIKYPEGCFHL